MDSVLIIAAEASSNLYAQRLLEHWARQGRKVQAFGVGNREMEKLGFECQGRSEEMAVMGIQEVVKHLPMIRRVFNSILSEVDRRQPRLAILMDYPGFNLRLAKELKKRGVKVVYYISPQVWAWKTGRVKLIREVVDHMLVLFPFEESFYREHGVKADFVGHPLLDELPPVMSPEERSLRRSKFGIKESDIVLGLMPGSRRSEISHHLQTQLQTAATLCRENPRVKVVLMVAPTLEREQLAREIADFQYPIQIIKESPLEMIDLADVILVASGTATLMVGLMKKPMVIMYRMNPITALLARLLVTKTKFFGLANIILDKQAVPELFQEDANPERLAAELRKFIDDRATYLNTEEELSRLRERLGKKGATENVARLLDRYFA